MITIRPAIETDLPQIRSINTHYIQNTSLTFAQTVPAAETYAQKLHNLTSRGLPYLVAVDPDSKTQDGDGDLVLGYAYLSPFRSQLVSYAPTVELSLFVHPDHQSRSIGSRLLSALLERVRGGEVVHRATGELAEVNDSAPHAAAAEMGVRVRNFIAIMAVDPKGRDGGEALRRWYIRRGLRECGRMVKVGFKRGHW